MKRYSQDQFGDMKESPSGKYVLYNEIGMPEIEASKIDVLEAFKDLIDECRELVSGAKNIVELYDAKTEAQIEWKTNWLMKSKILIGDK